MARFRLFAPLSDCAGCRCRISCDGNWHFLIERTKHGVTVERFRSRTPTASTAAPTSSVPLGWPWRGRLNKEAEVSTQQMSATEALDFHHFSVHNAVQAQLACPEASCEAYRDIFTRRRWGAQGYAVRKGEQGTVITVWIATPSRDDDGDDKPVRRSKRVFVFCRHQVDWNH